MSTPDRPATPPERPAAPSPVPGDERPEPEDAPPELTLALSPRQVLGGFALIAGLIFLLLRRRGSARKR